MGTLNLSAIEAAVAPLAAPLLQSLYTNQILPALTAALKSGSPEIQLVETEVLTAVTAIVQGLLTDLSKL